VKSGKALQRFDQFLSCFATRVDQQSVTFLTRCFEGRDKLGKLKGDTDGLVITGHVAALLVQTRSKAVQKMITDAHATLAPEVFRWSIMAGVRILNAKEVYEQFSPYYLSPAESKKKAADASVQRRNAVRESMCDLFSILRGAAGHRGAYYQTAHFGWGVANLPLEELPPDASLDPRWLDAAIETDDLRMVVMLARPQHVKACEFLSRKLDEMVSKKGSLDYQVSTILETMIRIEHPRVVEHYLAVLHAATRDKRQHYMYWFAQLIPSLPPSAAPQIEAMLPDMNEKVVDEIAPYLLELKSKV